MKVFKFTEAGNSLLELLVAMSASLILVGGASLALSILYSSTEKQTAEEIITLLEQASLCAVRSQETVEVTLKDSSMIENCKNRKLDLSKSYDYSSKFGGSNNAIAFYPSGFASAGTISINGDNNLCIISQTISGARKLECSHAS